MRKQILSYFYVLPMVIFLSSCGDPCYDLVNKICDYMRTSQDREACRAKLEARGKHPYINVASDPVICRAAMETCTEKAFMEHDYEKCGMAPAPASEEKISKR